MRMRQELDTYRLGIPVVLKIARGFRTAKGLDDERDEIAGAKQDRICGAAAVRTLLGPVGERGWWRSPTRESGA